MRPDLFKSIERAVNKLLHRNPQLLNKIQSYAGSIICIDLKNTQTVIYLSVHTDGLAISDSSLSKPDVTIRATPLELLNYLARVKQNDPVSSGNFEISGNINLAHDLQMIFSNFEFDWEEKLSEFLGDELSHTIGRISGLINKNIKYAKAELLINFSEYIKYEKDEIASPVELKQFGYSIETLRDDVERMNARINHLTELAPGE